MDRTEGNSSGSGTMDRIALSLIIGAILAGLWLLGAQASRSAAGPWTALGVTKGELAMGRCTTDSDCRQMEYERSLDVIEGNQK